jgi:arylsulfatase A
MRKPLFFWCSSVLVLGMVFAAMRSGCAGEPPPEPPNIVVILADDLGYGDLSCQNPDSKIPTPHLDRLAAEGVRCIDAHAPDAVCTPSRYGLLTGRYCWRSRLKHGVLFDWDKPLIDEDRLTLPKLLRRHGYATACFGKWHLGMDWRTKDGLPPNPKDNGMNVDFAKPFAGGPVACGFDYYFGVNLPNQAPYCFIENDRTLGIPSLPGLKGAYPYRGPTLPGWDLVQILPTITEHCVRSIEDQSRVSPRRPFLVYYALTAPHSPIVPAPEYLGKSRAGLYGDFVVQVDAVVGAVMQSLKNAGAADNTLLIFTSDNGPENAIPESNAYETLRRFQHASMGPLRGAKRDVWEGGHRVPFIARWPGKIPPGSVCRETICLTDLMATSAAIVGTRLPENAGEDSYNILPALEGRPGNAPIREATVLHSFSGKFAIRQGDWIFIDSPQGNDVPEPEWFIRQRGYQPHPFPGELYDLKDDLAQRKNRYGEKPEVVEKLKKLLEKYQHDGRSAPPPGHDSSSRS